MPIVSPLISVSSASSTNSPLMLPMPAVLTRKPGVSLARPTAAITGSALAAASFRSPPSVTGIKATRPSPESRPGAPSR